uniref:Uncharacterized protein n=1 Tax=Trypanosoma vivax (strain Y486) TaxID=1055687 RepID=G0TZA3_TRYVY|nr:hypothetical protein TVY486_0706240 [Trypanosoma vivax Y486]
MLYLPYISANTAQTLQLTRVCYIPVSCGGRRCADRRVGNGAKLVNRWTEGKVDQYENCAFLLLVLWRFCELEVGKTSCISACRVRGCVFVKEALKMTTVPYDSKENRSVLILGYLYCIIQRVTTRPSHLCGVFSF